MFFKADDFEMDTYALELNYLVKTILGCFQALWTKTPDRARCLANSEPSAISDSAVNLHPSPTFSPKVCMLLTVKQQIYLVLFLNDSSVWPIGDPRTVSTQIAVHFARQFGLAGVAMAAEPFVLAPGLIGLVKERGLFTISYGNLNDMVEAAKVCLSISLF